MSNTNIYVGCGNDIIDGFIHCDIRKLENVDIVCNAWDLSKHIDNVDLIYSRHMLEHLTNIEAYRTLQNWHKCLNDNGKIQLIVPNIDFYFKQWLNAKWDIGNKYGNLSNEIFSLSSIYGWQRESDPMEIDKPTYWDVHKSGYNKNRLEYILSDIGYKNIKIDIINEVHLQAIAYKNSSNNTNTYAVGNFRENISLDDKRVHDILVKVYNNLQKLDKSKQYILYGYGSIAKLIYPHIKDNIIAIIDQSLSVREIDGVKVINYADLTGYEYKDIIISVYNDRYNVKDKLHIYNCNYFELI